MNPEQDLAMAKTIAEKVAGAGGRAYFVGGFVILVSVGMIHSHYPKRPFRQ